MTDRRPPCPRPNSGARPPGPAIVGAFTTVFGAQLWGLLCAGLLGAVRARAAALELLAKNQGLEAVGIPSLPGPDHWEILSGFEPGVAGAVFFGLSLGLGWGTLFGLSSLSTAGLGGKRGRALAAALFSLPAGWALVMGDPALAAVLACTAAGALGMQWRRPRKSGRELLLPAVATCVVALGLLPWAAAPEGAFTRLRDRYLLEHSLGLGLSQLYYRWTLYPAEVLKPLAARTQPTAAASDDRLSGDFCRDALRLRILCVGGAGAASAHLHLSRRDDSLIVAHRGHTSPWPERPDRRTEWWREFSRATDGAHALRKATAVGLFLGCPLALCWFLAVCAAALTTVLPGQGATARVAMALLAASLCALGLGLAGRPGDLHAGTPTGHAAGEEGVRSDVEALLRSAHPRERFQAARAAARGGPGTVPPLIEALSDPVLSVRYVAAQSLGILGGAAAEAALLQVLRGSEEWYVKERAYAGLWRMGWRPR